MKSYPTSDRNKVQRILSRGSYDKETIFKILDEGKVCHISFVVDGQPFIIPTIYGRSGEKIFIHGSVKSRMLLALEEGICLISQEKILILLCLFSIMPFMV